MAVGPMDCGEKVNVRVVVAELSGQGVWVTSADGMAKTGLDVWATTEKVINGKFAPFNGKM